MRIVICAVLYGRGGTETHLLHLCRLLAERGHEVTIACRYANRSVPLVQQSKALGMKRLSTPFDHNKAYYRWSTIAALLLWPWYLARHPADVIITLERSRFLRFLKRFLRPGGFILLLRAGLPTNPSEAFDPQIMALLDGVFTESPLQADASADAYPSLPVLGIPLLGNISTNIEARPAHKNITDPVRIAYMGRYDRKKGIFRLFDIWPSLAHANLRLDFYGHGGEKDTLLHEITRLGYTESMAVHDGWDKPEQLTALMSNIDLLILPSEEEGLPVILMEAMAHGVPFVATDIGAVGTYAQDNPDVRVVPLNNHLIAAAILEMVELIRGGQINGERLQRYYADRYAYNKLAKQWLDAIENAENWVNSHSDRVLI